MHLGNLMAKVFGGNWSSSLHAAVLPFCLVCFNSVYDVILP